MNQGWVYRDQISATDNGQTVLDYYCQRYRHSSQSEWAARIQSGQILLNDAPTTPTTLLQAGQWLTYHRPPWQEPEVPLSFEVLHEDSDLLIINKPSGLPVMPGGGFLQHTLLWQLKQQYPQDTPTPIHRLGRGTSGLLLLARSPHARAHLSQQMRDGSSKSNRDRSLRKTYLAIVGSGTIPDEFSIDTPIGKIPHPTLGYLHAATPKGKFAYSEGHVLQRSATQTLVEVTIFTGRPHQIRIHLAAIGFPLIGDPLYGIGGIPIQHEDISVPGHCGYFLHAHRLTFIHPSTETQMTIECSPPKAFLKRLKG
jgi:23S rRNA pseudouridine1911/1915/1917 synthase